MKQRNRHRDKTQRNQSIKADPANSTAYELTDREKKALKAIRNDPEAKRDFDFLQRKIGCSEKFLIIHFVMDAWLPKPDDDLPTGIQRRKLKALASCIEQLAERIQEANDLSYWRFAFVRVDLRENGGLASEADLKRLPELLRLYARNVRKKVETDQAFANVDNVHDLEFEATEALLSWIKERTGRRYRDRVASVQRVVYEKAGRKRPPASGETLRKREQRRQLSLPPQKAGHPRS